MKVRIIPSILSADLGNLQAEVESVSSADSLQIDVMDGHFVPNLSFGAPVAACIKTTLPLDVHLMVSNPADRIKEFLALKVSHITFHAEAVPETADRKALIEAIKKGGATAGIALKPATPISAISDVISDCDLVLVMTVEPGFGAQKFMPGMLKKVTELRSKFPDLRIQVDGGINAETAAAAAEAGADELVAGSFVFHSRDRVGTILSLRA